MRNRVFLHKPFYAIIKKEEEYNIFAIFMHVLICFYYLCTQL